MGVDYYYCESCQECLHSGYFSYCSECEEFHTVYSTCCRMKEGYICDNCNGSDKDEPCMKCKIKRKCKKKKDCDDCDICSTNDYIDYTKSELLIKRKLAYKQLKEIIRSSEK
jgi:hypothetical protein